MSCQNVSILCYLRHPAVFCPACNRRSSRRAKHFPLTGAMSASPMCAVWASGGRGQLGNLTKSLSEGLTKPSSTNGWSKEEIFFSITKGLARHDWEPISMLPCCSPTPRHAAKPCSYGLEPWHPAQPSPSTGLVPAPQALGVAARAGMVPPHSAFFFSDSVQITPFQSIFLFKTDPRAQTPFISLIILRIKYLFFCFVLHFVQSGKMQTLPQKGCNAFYFFIFF